MDTTSQPGTSAQRGHGRDAMHQAGARGQAVPPGGGFQTNKWVVLAIAGIGVLMSTIDSSIVNISLPAIAHYFGVGLTGTVEWVIIAYLVIIAAVLLSVGRLTDIVGRRPLWAIGLAIFIVGSVLCGAAPSLLLLIVFRTLQGLGGALLFAVSPAMITSAFPESERGRALGLNALIVAFGVSAGPTIGGVITDHLTWRWIFYVNVPLGILGFVATLRMLKEVHVPAPGRFDPAGAVLLAVGLAALTLGLSFGQEWGWTSARLLISLAIALVSLVALVAIERRVRDPIIPLGLLKNRVFASANVSLILSFLALFAVSFMLPFYFEELRGYSAEQAGFLLTPLPLAIMLVAPFSGRLADRIGTRWLAAAGLAVACVGLLFLSQLDAQTSIWGIIWRLMFTGVGQGLFQSPNNSALIGAAPRVQRGIASGFLATGRVVGQSLSVALAGAVFASFGGAAAGSALAGLSSQRLDAARVIALRSAFDAGFHGAFVVCATIAAIGVVTSLVRGRERTART